MSTLANSSPPPSAIPLFDGGHHGSEVTALATLEPDKPPFGAMNIEGPAASLSVELDVGVPIRNFRVRNLLALDLGVVVASQWGHAEDLPLKSGNQPLAWSEFEVVDTHLAVRLTRLS